MSVGLAMVVVTIGGLAAVLRYGVSLFVASRHHGSWLHRFPWAVFVVNAVGSAIAGVAAGLASTAALSADTRLVLVTGLAGGLTTFSTFSVETVELVRIGRLRTAAWSVAINLVIGFAAAGGGYVIARALTGS